MRPKKYRRGSRDLHQKRKKSAATDKPLEKVWREFWGSMYLSGVITTRLMSWIGGSCEEKKRETTEPMEWRRPFPL